jgi:hypothetical protein
MSGVNEAGREFYSLAILKVLIKLCADCSRTTPILLPQAMYMKEKKRKSHAVNEFVETHWVGQNHHWDRNPHVLMPANDRNLNICEVHHPCESHPRTEHQRDRDDRESENRRNQVRQDLYSERKTRMVNNF